MAAYGLIDAEALDNYLRDGTNLWGHVTRTSAFPVIDASTGSLGHGLGLALGYAQAYRLSGVVNRAFCIMSDGELDEGSVWEAALYAGARNFGNLTAVVDYNKIQSLDRVSAVMDLAPLPDKWRAFHWEVREADGHDLKSLQHALENPPPSHPLLVLAHTIKGKGLVHIEDTVASHYKPATEAEVAMLAGINDA
jgi:transketolase